MSKKQQSKELMRLKTVIESDRLSVGSNFDELIVSDLESQHSLVCKVGRT